MATALWLIAILTSLPLIYLALELAVGIPKPSDGRHPPALGATEKAMILIPAHNESVVIGQTVRRLLEGVSSATEVLVVADNCDDDTAARARAAGAQVIERYEPHLRGKGHALAFGREHLRTEKPSVIIVLDADCALSEGGDQLLVSKVLQGGNVAQASNLVIGPANASPLVQISNFAMLIKNSIRARGMERIGGGVMLFGTGMAFPWEVFERAPLASSDVVEDMELALWLARSGHRILLEERACVTSAAAALPESAGQRRRWEHGFLRTALRNAFPSIAEGIMSGSRYRLAMGLHLLVPPLALLYIFSAVALTVLASAAVSLNYWLPLSYSLATWFLASTLLMFAWTLYGRSVLTPFALAFVPFYALWKIPIYAAFFISRQKDWNRTKRVTDDVSGAN